jgi:transcriptional regulator
MAKQKLTSKDIELIKHWGSKGFTHKLIASQMGCSRANITKILNEYRWSEIKQPNYARGEELHYRFLQYGTLSTNA